MIVNNLKELYLKFAESNLENLYQKGRFHLDKKNFELANFYFKQMVNIQPQHFWATVHLADIATENGLYSIAMTGYQKALTLTKLPTEICTVNCSLASVFISMELFDFAEHHYLQSLAQYPEHIFFYTGLAKLYKTYQPDAIEKIAELYQKAQVLAPHLNWIETELKTYQNKISKKTELGIKEPNLKPSAFQLYLQGSWLDLFIQEDAAIPLLNSHIRREIINSLKALPQDAFIDLSLFYRHVADYLTQGFIIEEEVFNDIDQLKAAAIFLSRAIKTSIAPDAALYIQTFNILIFLDQFTEAEPLILQALLNHSDQADLLLTIARLMYKKSQKTDKSLKILDLKIAQLAGDQSKLTTTSTENGIKISQLRTEKEQLIADKISALSASRLLFGEAVSIAPEKLTEQDWTNLINIHDQANQNKAKKFTDLNHYLLESAVAKQAQALNINTPSLAQVDIWLHELSVLLNDFSIEVFFDLAYYCKQTKLWFPTADTALTHYFTTGWKHNISVHPSFDSDYVRQQLQQRDKPSSAPELLLFLRYERELELVANVLFNAQRLAANTPAELGSPWLHYLAGGWQTLANPSDFFDTELYLETGAYSENGKIDSALVHFLKHDVTKECNRLFHTQFYLKHYHASLNGKPPIVHYLTEGAYRGYLPNPFYEMSNETGSNRIDYLKLLSL